MSEPLTRGDDGRKFCSVILSICAIEAPEMLMALWPVRPPPSMTPPEMEMRVCPLAEAETAALAVVEELIWILPFSSTLVFDESRSGVAPTVNVPLRRSTITLLGLAGRGAFYWFFTSSIVVEFAVRSVGPLPFPIGGFVW